MYQELVDKCKQAYKEKNMPLALKYWEEIYNITDKKLNEENKNEDKQRLEVWKEHNKYMEQFTNDEVYGITDYGKRKAYEKQAREDILEGKEQLELGNDLDILDDFCDMYSWLPIKNKDNTYNIVDLELNKMVEEEDYKTFKELINRIVGRAIDYYCDEMDLENEENVKEYGEKLYKIALKYKKQDKWEDSWLNEFKKDLESFDGK